MPTILTHAVVPLAIGLGLGRARVSPKLLLAGVALAVLPDLDGIGFKLGIPYASAIGHRGASHSLIFALVAAWLVSLLSSRLQASTSTAFWFLFLTVVSHPLLDMLTNGGLGVALLWPFSNERFFAPWQVIEVSPIALRRVFSEKGAAVLFSEVKWVWLPLLAIGAAFYLGRRASEQRSVR